MSVGGGADVPHCNARDAALAPVAGWIARAASGEGEVPPRLGEITLHPHQRDAAALLRRIMRRHGGALLADEPGLGKTFASLGAASAYHSILVVAPAALRPMWHDALRRCGLSADLASYEQLGAGRRPLAHGSRWDLVILDEAHHARNPSTRRYRALAQLTWGAHVLLVSASPIHNRRGDLLALLALFLGSGVHAVPDAGLAPLIVRRRAGNVPSIPALPTLHALEWVAVPLAAGVVEALLAIPPPLPPADGGSGGALVALALLRAWCSSDAALLSAIRRRLAIAAALEHALEHGTLPTRRELAAWSGDGEAIQLALPILVATPPAEGEAPDVLLRAVRVHAAALRLLRDHVQGEGARDGARFAALRSTLDRHRGRRAVVFTHSRETAVAAFRALSARHRVGFISGAGSRIASGPLARAEVLQAFSATSPPASDRMRLDVLVATDVMSEGIDLSSASVVVHLDLPWTPARLEQRGGRARRLGSREKDILQIAVAPPLSAEAMHLVVRRLAEKAGTTQRVVGVADGLQALAAAGLWAAAPGASLSSVEAMEAIRMLCEERGWSPGPAEDSPGIGEQSERRTRSGAVVPVACLSSGIGERGAVAVVSDGDICELVAVRDGAVVADARDVFSLLRSGDRVRPVPPGAAREGLTLLGRWSVARAAESQALAVGTARTAMHRAMLRRVAQAADGGGRLHRSVMSRLGADARAAILGSRGVGSEEVLRQLLSRGPPSCPPREWLGEVRDALAPRARPAAVPGPSLRVAALLLLEPNE